LQFAKTGSEVTLPQKEKNNSVDVPRSDITPRGVVFPSSSSRWQIAPRRPPAALPGANRTFLLPVNYHKREVNDFACVTHFWRGSPAAQPGAGVRRQLSCDGAHCPFLGPPRGQKHFFRGICNFVLSSEIRKTERGRTSRRHHNHHHAPEARFLF
jgi:hypothetical protein